MNFNKLLSEKKIEDVEKKEFKADLIQKSLEFAEKGLETENYDDVMAMTYNIIFKISNRLINSLGYRAIGKEHHKNLFEFLKEAVPGDLVEYFDKIRIKRNNFIYRDIEIVSKEEAEEIRTFVQEIRTGGENE